jgi:hypothetical protein
MLTLTGVSEAAVLFTPSVLYLPGDSLQCNVVNVGSSDVRVTIDHLDATGAIIHPYTDTLRPGESRAISLGPFPGPTTSATCRFTFAGPRTSIRAIAIYERGGTQLIHFPAE